MAKGYWVTTYESIYDADKLAAYAKLAAPAIVSSGGRFLVRGVPAEVHELGLKERTVVIEFDSLDAARAAYVTPAYKAALVALGNAVRRDLRIVEGL